MFYGLGQTPSQLQKWNFVDKPLPKFQGKPGQWANVKYESPEFLFSIVLTIYIYIQRALRSRAFGLNSSIKQIFKWKVFFFFLTDNSIVGEGWFEP